MNYEDVAGIGLLLMLISLCGIIIYTLIVHISDIIDGLYWLALVATDWPEGTILSIGAFGFLLFFFGIVGQL